MNNKSFDEKRIAEGYAKRPWLHKGVMEQIKKDMNVTMFDFGLDVGCGAGLSTKALRLICNHVTGTDISSEMINICKKIYVDSSYEFYVSKAEETKKPADSYNIITAAGVINWVDREKFLLNAEKILAPNGIIVIYDFWITNQMIENKEYTNWYQSEYLTRFPKPYRKENIWTDDDLINTFSMEKQTTFTLEYEFSMNEFIDFMMIQSNVNEKIDKKEVSVEEVKQWMTDSLTRIFEGKKRTLIFEGYNWYLRKN